METALRHELDNYIKKTKVIKTTAQLRELIHGMIGAFHFTGAISIKSMLTEIQKQAKTKDFHDIMPKIDDLSKELEKLKDYLDKQNS